MREDAISLADLPVAKVSLTGNYRLPDDPESSAERSY
jgi:hypothetical protein